MGRLGRRGGHVEGPAIKVEVTGTVIAWTDVGQVQESTHNSPHPGKGRTSGHFGFAGQNDLVAFRNIQIESLDREEVPGRLERPHEPPTERH